MFTSLNSQQQINEMLVFAMKKILILKIRYWNSPTDVSQMQSSLKFSSVFRILLSICAYKIPNFVAIGPTLFQTSQSCLFLTLPLYMALKTPFMFPCITFIMLIIFQMSIFNIELISSLKPKNPQPKESWVQRILAST